METATTSIASQRSTLYKDKSHPQNGMPQKAVEVSSVNSFKSHLEKIRHTQMDFFMDN